MWKVLSERAEGSSHRRAGNPCQDYCWAAELPLAGETVLVLLASDGAGSASCAHVGSQRTCDVMAGLIFDWLRRLDHLVEISAELVIDWLQRLHRELDGEALARQTEIRQLASTFLGAVVGESAAAFFQVGDGVLVTRQGDGYEHVFWPRNGEYVNLTHFVTDPQVERALEFLWCPRRIDEVALLTDGLQRLALDYKMERAHGPFFAPMFKLLRACADPASLSPALRSFLASPAVEARTDDDKTLILATRLNDDAQLV
jgi:hypothetical protein